MKKMEEYAEGLVRYKKHYPEICEGRTDIEILIYRNLITPEQADKLEKEIEKPKSNAGGVGKDLKKKENNPKPVKPYTENQVKKLGKGIAKDWLADNPGRDIEEVAFDLAEAALFLEDRRLEAFFIKTGVDKKNWKEAMAEYINI